MEHWLKDKLEGKIIYCNCDSEESNFVKYFKEHKEELKYKDLWYTSDDYRNHFDLLLKCDIVITNPPFSLFIKEYFPALIESRKEFFVFGFHVISDKFETIWNMGGIKMPILSKIDFTSMNFITDKNEIKPIHVSVYTNLKGIKSARIANKRIYETIEFTKKFDEIPHEYIDYAVDGKRVLHCKYMKNFPIDYDGWVAVSTTTLFLVFEKFDILTESIRVKKDGKWLFKRAIVKLKKEYR